MKKQGRLSPARFCALVFVAAFAAIVAGASSTGAATTPPPPSNTSAPTISGKYVDGSTLTASHGSWTNSPTSYSYRWERCDSAGANCSTISGATSNTYTLTTADVGHRLRVAVTATNAGGSGTATSGATPVIQPAGAAPANTAAPSISGTPQQDATLTASPGTWNGTTPMSFAYQWLRCDKTGAACTNITGATGKTYTLTAADVAYTIRVQVTATNARGSGSAQSQPTALIAPAKSTQSATLSVQDIALPDRLVIDQVRFSPNPARSLGPIVARFHVSDTRGFSVAGALVYALGLPYGWTYNAPEVATGQGGWATVVLHPTRALPIRHGGALVVFVRARKPGDNLLAGVSTRRLVQESVG